MVVSAVDPFVPLDKHHPALQFELNAMQRIVYEDEFDAESRNFRKTDYVALKRDLAAVDWVPVLACTNVDVAVARFYDIVRSLLYAHTPVRRPPSNPPWSNARLKRLKQKRFAALQKYSNRRCAFLRAKFKKASLIYRRYKKKRYSDYVRKTQLNLRHNPKQFWSFVKSKRKENGLPTTMTYGTETASNNTEKCRLFANFFASVFNVHNDAEIDLSCLDTVPADLVSVDTFVISDSMLQKAIKKMKSSFAPGPDGIPAVLLKRCEPELFLPLLKIMNLSMQDATFPSEWKRSFMFPVFKKGEKRRVENYRGITSLCACSKLLEIIVCDALMFNCRGYIAPEQHGFVAGRSVASNLMEFVTACYDSISKGYQVDAIYTDLKAAFDRIDHDVALCKFAKLGFTVRMCRWLESYLKGRCLQVKLGCAVSDEFTNCSGVPQGSNLGPVTFARFYNDVGSSFRGNCKLAYADDFKLFTTVESLADCYVLQSHIDLFAEWCRRNRLTLSVEKCIVISFHHKTSREVFSFDYALSNQILQRVDCVKDLGVWLDSKLSFRQQQSAVIDKANRQLGFIFKIAREFNDTFCLRSLYCSLVRPHLETSAVIWSPYHRNWIDRVEKIQRKFVWYAGRDFHWQDPLNLPPYEHRCELLGLMTLENRRKLTKALFAARLLVGELDCPNLLEQLGAAVQARSLRPRTGFLQRPASSSEYMRHSPFHSMCSTFNEFYDLFEFGESTSSFRSKLISALSVRGQLEASRSTNRTSRILRQ